jgi:glycerol-3-phosphate dehydrogenase
VILTRTQCTAARRVDGRWQVELVCRETGQHLAVRARALVNAAGPWVEQVLGRIAGINSGRRIRLVKGSHIVTQKFWDGPQAYLLQNTDRRVIFVNPYEGDLALIGTTDIAVDGDPEEVAIEPAEIDYLLAVVNRYFARDLTPADVLHSFAGVRPLYDDEAANPSAITRDYVFEVEPERRAQGLPPLLSVFGGKITTYRKLAEHALEKLAPFLGDLGPAWTAGAPLPGGDMANADFDAFLAGLRHEHPWLPPDLARHYARLYGTRARDLLGDAAGIDGLGRHLGGLLYAREADYLCRVEWARTSEDILERRTKHGLHLGDEQKRALRRWLQCQRPTVDA